MQTRFSRIAVLALAAGVIGAMPVAVSFAQSAADTVNVRRAAMKELGVHNKALVDFLKGDQDPKKAAVLGTMEDMELRAQAIASNASRMPAMFPAGTGMDKQPPKTTGAKPEIWSDAKGFAAAADKLKTTAEAVEKAAASGNKQALATAVAVMGKEGCGGCHTKYREKI